MRWPRRPEVAMLLALNPACVHIESARRTRWPMKFGTVQRLEGGVGVGVGVAVGAGVAVGVAVGVGVGLGIGVGVAAGAN
jgi:hypothetical protein